MRAVDVGWLAGILDGEGTITLLARDPPRFRQPTLSVTSTDREILLALQALIKGNISRHTRADKKAEWRQAWIWKLNGADNVLQVLACVLPHLRCPKKRRRSEYLLSRYKHVTRRNGHYTSEERELKQKFEEKFFLL